jgi:hypothetical protein
VWCGLGLTHGYPSAVASIHRPRDSVASLLAAKSRVTGSLLHHNSIPSLSFFRSSQPPSPATIRLSGLYSASVLPSPARPILISPLPSPSRFLQQGTPLHPISLGHFKSRFRPLLTPYKTTPFSHYQNHDFSHLWARIAASPLNSILPSSNRFRGLSRPRMIASLQSVDHNISLNNILSGASP